jgi:predicted TIM-barrel fold metal-dependent hydrolase
MSNEGTPVKDKLSRRQLLALGAALTGGPLGGCAWLTRKPTPICPASPEVSFPGGPLTIDAHCHVFNGTDLQVKDFLSMVAIKQTGALGLAAQAISTILQELAWSSAPKGTDELAELKQVAKVLQACKSDDSATKLGTLRQAAYKTGRAQLRAALRKSEEFRAPLEQFTANRVTANLEPQFEVKLQTVSIIERLPEDVEDYRREQLASFTTMSLGSRSVSGLIAFVLQNFQYRYVTVYDYLSTYDKPGERVVDLMLPSMVDYDWWLAKGAPTPTSLATQVQVMQQISILTGGRVHGFAAYDPLRQVAAELGHAPQDSLSVVQDAVQKYGCAGVKLYPPMGFAALGNATLARQSNGKRFWARDWLPTWMDRDDMGTLLDGAMKKILHWCEDNEVPIMAHTNISNGVDPDFQALAGSQYWALALKETPRLRVNFGHFGDTSPVADGTTAYDRADAFAKLMAGTTSGASGSHAYADAGYFVEVMASAPTMLSDLKRLYVETAGKGDAALASRFLYGTDWEMTLAEGKVNTYLSSFVGLFNDFEQDPALRSQGLANLSARFFGANAADFIGLRSGGQARRRLDDFYDKNAVPAPDWRTKVDGLKAQGL